MNPFIGSENKRFVIVTKYAQEQQVAFHLQRRVKSDLPTNWFHDRLAF